VFEDAWLVSLVFALLVLVGVILGAYTVLVFAVRIGLGRGGRMAAFAATLSSWLGMPAATVADSDTDVEHEMLAGEAQTGPSSGLLKTSPSAYGTS
jgi:hypothetical protein